LLAGFADGKKRRSAKKSESREQADRLAISRYGALSLSRVPLASPTLLLSFFVQSQDQDQDTYRNDAEYKLLHSLRASDVNLQLQHNCQSFVVCMSSAAAAAVAKPLVEYTLQSSKAVQHSVFHADTKSFSQSQPQLQNFFVHSFAVNFVAFTLSHFWREDASFHIDQMN
jgi:hypothetical protein